MVRSSAMVLALGIAGIAAAAGLGTWAENTTEFKLANGMRFVVLERPSSSTVSLTLLAQAGWADDPPGKRGLSRILQRIVEEGGYAFGSKNPADEKKAIAEAEALTDKWEAEANKPQPDDLLAARLRVEAENAAGLVSRLAVPGQFRAQLTDAGGGFVSTQADAASTLFTATLPVEQADVWFTGMAAWLADPAWRNFYRHRSQAAAAGSRMDEQSVVLTALAAKAFPGHAWAQPDMLLAEMQNVRIRDLAAFHRMAFAPGNIVVGIAGNLSPAAVRALAEKHFGGLAAQPAMQHDWANRDAKPYEAPGARAGMQLVTIGYPRPPFDSPDDAVLDVLGTLLVYGPDAYLQTKLVKPRLLFSVNGVLSYPANTGGGLLTLAAVPVPGRTLRETEASVQEALTELASAPIPEPALLAAKRRLIATAVRGLEDDSFASELLARYVSTVGSAKALAEALVRFEAVSDADIRRVAQKYLRPEARVSFHWAGPRQ